MSEKKRKMYMGDIPFDLHGNQQNYGSGAGMQLTKDDILEYSPNTNRLVIRVDTYDYKTSSHVPVVRDLSDFKYDMMIYDAPRKAHWGDKIYVGEVRNVRKFNYVFSDTLTFGNISKGRSATVFHWTSKTNGKEYTCFAKDFCEFFADMMCKREIQGNFTFRKHGSNYGLTLAV